jgi:hypothetical protein
VITGPEFSGRIPGDMTEVSLRTKLGFCAVRIAVTGSADLPNAPVSGMWNLAMYDDEMFFVANDADRFTIGSTTDGVTANPDGSLTVYIQTSRPDAAKAPNWLPAPTGSFNLTMRYYGPLSPVLDRTCSLPAPRKA